MNKIFNLVSSARESSMRRGHRMGTFTYLTRGNAISKCIDCDAEVQVLSNPAPNQIDIGGTSVALNCPIVWSHEWGCYV